MDKRAQSLVEERALLIVEILSKLEVKVNNHGLLAMRGMMVDDFCENAPKYAVYAGFAPDFVLQVIECGFTRETPKAAWVGMKAAVGWNNLELLKAILDKFDWAKEYLLHEEGDFLLRLALQRGHSHKEIVDFLQQN